MKAYPPPKRLPIFAIALTTLLQFALNVHAQQDLSQTETRVNEILSKMTLDEKLDYIGGGYPSSSSIISGVFNIKVIPRLGLPWITMVNGPLGIQTLSGAPSTRYPAGLTLAATWNSQRAFAKSLPPAGRVEGGNHPAEPTLPRLLQCPSEGLGSRSWRLYDIGGSFVSRHPVKWQARESLSVFSIGCR
jgi:hypothetical protein